MGHEIGFNIGLSDSPIATVEFTEPAAALCHVTAAARRTAFRSLKNRRRQVPDLAFPGGILPDMNREKQNV